MQPTSVSKGNSAFTLLEILVALFLIVLITSIALFRPLSDHQYLQVASKQIKQMAVIAADQAIVSRRVMRITINKEKNSLQLQERQGKLFVDWGEATYLNRKVNIYALLNKDKNSKEQDDNIYFSPIALLEEKRVILIAGQELMILDIDNQREYLSSFHPLVGENIEEQISNIIHQS